MSEKPTVPEPAPFGADELMALAASAPIGLFVATERDGVVLVNDCFEEITGRRQEELLGDGWIATIHPDDRSWVIEETARLQSDASVEHRVLRPDGSVRHVQVRPVPVRVAEGVLKVVGSVLDVTDAKADVVALRASEARLQDQASLLEMIATSAPIEETLREVCRMVEGQLTGTRCTVLLTNDELQVLHYGAAPSFPQSFVEATDGLAIKEGSAVCGTAAARAEVVIVPDVLDEPTCSEFADLARANNIRGCWSTPILASMGGRVLGTLATYLEEARPPDSFETSSVDAAAALAAIAVERHDVASRLAAQAHHDTLTGLPNRNLFGELLEHALRRAQRSGSAVAVLFLDLDRFKIVNDSRGHDAGDVLLGAVADRLESVLRPGDVVARFGGDEFTVLCEDLERPTAGEQAIGVADRLVEALREPFTIEGEDLFMGVSIGIAVGVTGLELPDALLRDADAAMYLAKERGRGRCEVFDQAMQAQARKRHDVENALHRAVAREEFRVFFQPMVELAKGACIGVEALARWQHPERGLLGPGDFLRSAEETGLVVPIGQIVLERACRRVVEWRAVVPDPSRFRVSVNLSSRQLLHVDLPDLVGDVLERTGLPPRALCIEITESVVLDDPEAGLLAVKALKALGVQVCIDDFGTGYSALGYLREFPIDEVKIDRSFVAKLGSEPEESAIVAAVVSLGHGLGVTVTGEGVETPDQVEMLRSLGVDAAQGFLFAPPQPADDLTARLMCPQPWV